MEDAVPERGTRRVRNWLLARRPQPDEQLDQQPDRQPEQRDEAEQSHSPDVQPDVPADAAPGESAPDAASTRPAKLDGDTFFAAPRTDDDFWTKPERGWRARRAERAEEKAREQARSADEAAVRARGAQRDPSTAPADRAAGESTNGAADGSEATQSHRGLSKGARTLRTLVIVAVVAVVGAFLLRTFVVESYYVPSASMEPTLHGCPGCNDDHVLVEKLSYRFHDVQAGDVVVFDRPSSGPWAERVPEHVLIKRVIGVAGDRLVVKNGRVYRNGQVISEPYVNQRCRPATTPEPGRTTPSSRAYPIVANGRVFVMGDNRCDSEDSRLLGTIPTANVIGRAFLIVWPVGRIHSL